MRKLFELTWKCMACGETRPDACISVHKRDISEEWKAPLGTVTENFRYCNDRDMCHNNALIGKKYCN